MTDDEKLAAVQAIAEHARMLGRLGDVLSKQLVPSFAAVVALHNRRVAERDALRARVAELEAECTRQYAECERFKAQRDEAAARAGLRLAERDAALATLERVRLTAGAWKDFASSIAEKAWTRESTEGREAYGEALAECAEEIEAVLGERSGQAEPAPRTNLERVRGLIAGWRAADPCDPRGAELALRDAADELEDALASPG